MKKAELEARCKALELSLVNSERMCEELKVALQSQIAWTKQAWAERAATDAKFEAYVALPWYERALYRP